MGAPGLIQREWESYLAEVMPRDAYPIQVKECRRAFFSGARGLFSGLMAAMSPEQGEPTEADYRLAEEVEAELAAFSEDVQAGRA